MRGRSSANADDRISGGATSVRMARRPGATKAETAMTTQIMIAANHSTGAPDATRNANPATTPAMHNKRRLSAGESANRRWMARVPTSTKPAAMVVPTPIRTPRRPGSTPNSSRRKKGTITPAPRIPPAQKTRPMHW